MIHGSAINSNLEDTLNWIYFYFIQQVVQEVIATGQSGNVEGLVGAGAGLNLIPQIGQVQYIQDTENGQIIHYQLSDQYGQILQHDPSQTQVNTICMRLNFFKFNEYLGQARMLMNSKIVFDIPGNCHNSRRCAPRDTISTHCCYNSTSK